MTDYTARRSVLRERARTLGYPRAGSQDLSEIEDWLRETHGIEVTVPYHLDNRKYRYILKHGQDEIKGEPQDDHIIVEILAIEAALDLISQTDHN